MANISYRTNKNGEVSARIRISKGYDYTGKQIYCTKTIRYPSNWTQEKIRKEAEKEALRYEELCKNADSAHKRKKFHVVADEYLALIEKSNDMRTNSLQRMIDCKERTYKAIGHIYMDKLSHSDIQSFITSLGEDGVNKKTQGGLSTKTQKHYLTFIRNVYAYAKSKEMVVKDNICNYIKVTKKPPAKKKPYTLDEVGLIFNTILSEAPLKYRLFFNIAAYTGMRRGEILGLEFSDFDRDGVYKVKRSMSYNKKRGTYTGEVKTEESERVLKLPKRIMNDIYLLKAEHQRMKKLSGDLWTENNRLFTQDNGKPMHPNTPYNWLSRQMKAKGLGENFKGLHSFRRFFATEVANSNEATVFSAKTALGHKKIDTTMRYVTGLSKATEQALKVVSKELSKKTA